MSKSTKLPIVKDVGFMKKTYHKVIRSNINQKLKQVKDIEDAEELEIPEPETIIDDYDYCDWRFDMRDEEDDSKYKIKAKRK